MAISIKGKHSGSKEAVLAFARAQGAKRFSEVEKFVNTLFSQNIFDGFMIAAQSANETTNWTDDNWNSRLNPGGIGVTGGKDFKYVFADGDTAAKAMLVHHAAYTGTTIPAAWKDWVKLDPRYQAVFDAGYNGKVKNWENYGHGYWAEDPNYFEAVTSRAAEIKKYGGTPSSTPTPSQKTPNILDRYLHVSQLGYAGVERRYKGRAGMSPKVIVLHIQEGYNLGSWQWFHETTASATVLIAKNGDIWRLVPETDAPWTNGDVKSPTTKGRSLMNTYGPDPNYYTLSIETEGFTGEWPKPQAELSSVLWQIRQWMKTYNIPLERVIRHADINQVTRPACPGDDYYNWILQQLVDIPTEPLYAKATPVLVGNTPWTGKEDFTREDGTVFHADPQDVEAIKAGAVHVYATKDSAVTRKPLDVGEDFSVFGWVVGEKVGEENRWWITKSYSRVWVGNTKQQPNKTVPVPENPDETTDENPDVITPEVTIHNGRVYYKTLENGKERHVVATKDTPLYKSATPRSAKVGTLKKGEERVVTHYTLGDEVDGESMWWVLSAGKANPITQGARIPVGSTLERPE